MVVDLFLVYQFIKRLATPFKEWDAYELGIIDEKGNQLKKRKEFTKTVEHNAYGIFDILVTKLKRLLEKVPGGKTRLGSYAAALYLIKEHKNIENIEDLSEQQMHDKLCEYMSLAEELKSDDINVLFETSFEEDIANVTGNVAGTGGKQGEPGLTKKQMDDYKKKNKKGLVTFRRHIDKGLDNG